MVPVLMLNSQLPPKADRHHVVIGSNLEPVAMIADTSSLSNQNGVSSPAREVTTPNAVSSARKTAGPVNLPKTTLSPNQRTSPIPVTANAKAIPTSLPPAPAPPPSTSPVLSTLGPPPTAPDPPPPGSTSLHIQPQYHVPYFMSPFLAPYTSSSRYPFSTTAQLYPRDPYAPSPMYQPAFTPFPPYTYPPPGVYAQPFPPPPPPTVTPTTPTTSPSPAKVVTPAPALTSHKSPVPTPKQATASAPPMAALPPRPPDAAPLYSTFSSRPGGSAAQNSIIKTSAFPDSPSGKATQNGAEMNSIKFTFSAKTGELYTRAPGELRRKRVGEQADTPPASKRLETILTRGAGGPSATTTSIAQAPTTGHQARQSQVDAAIRVSIISSSFPSVERPHVDSLYRLVRLSTAAEPCLQTLLAPSAKNVEND